MIDLLGTIVWDLDPVIVEIGPLTPRWYGLMFVFAFGFGNYIMTKIFKLEGVDEGWLDKLLIYMVVAVVVGARLGHVIFYQWDYYSQHLLEILMVWKGGLASHGAAIAIPTAMVIFSYSVTKRSPLWVLDRIVIVVALSGFFIRMGNFFNSEIVGQATNLPWGVKFPRYEAHATGITDLAEMSFRHPSQIYESLFYLMSFLLLGFLYKKTKSGNREGLLFGVFLVVVFGFRFFIEFIKANQVVAEEGMSLNIGQQLSIPMVLVGVGFIIWAMKKPLKNYVPELKK